MKKSLFLYLFILAVLLNIFTYMYYSKENAFEKQQLDTTTKVLSDSVKTLKDKMFDANYFSLENNQAAQDYFENPTTGEFLAPEKLIPYVKEKLVAFNDGPNGNPYTGQEKIEGKKFIIDHVKILNHRWIIADFTNTEVTGEAIIKYFINDDKSVDFETAESVIYAK